MLYLYRFTTLVKICPDKNRASLNYIEYSCQPLFQSANISRTLCDSSNKLISQPHLDNSKLLVEKSSNYSLSMKWQQRLLSLFRERYCIHEHTRSSNQWPGKEANSDLNLSSPSYDHSYLINSFDVNISFFLNKEFH